MSMRDRLASTPSARMVTPPALTIIVTVIVTGTVDTVVPIATAAILATTAVRTTPGVALIRMGPVVAPTAFSRRGRSTDNPLASYGGWVPA